MVSKALTREVLGALCVIDAFARHWTDLDVEVLDTPGTRCP
jgi:hypothetical protein